ncbi:hypothetical protein BDV96DRAFT_130806 [Lophiotrema nucula]|uniref:Uncharacterized protein n=1 Tax=Lophiotrema nucula TaxID=690887 RepID=A0A6A5ZRW2_9PLEO|nr:hypothetical protein BDV96DRAFT_130806 [Lophiotrema nucula]
MSTSAAGRQPPAARKVSKTLSLEDAAGQQCGVESTTLALVDGPGPDAPLITAEMHARCSRTKILAASRARSAFPCTKRSKAWQARPGPKSFKAPAPANRGRATMLGKRVLETVKGRKHARKLTYLGAQIPILINPSPAWLRLLLKIKSALRKLRP